MMPGGRVADVPKRRSGPKSKTSCYLGVTQYKRTGRWEAHIWDSSDPDYKKGRQLHLGSFPAAVPAAIAYDRAAYIIKPRNISRNFPATDYSKDDFILRHAHLNKAEFVSQLRNWAQDPHLAVVFSTVAPRSDRFMRPPVLTPPIELPPKQIQQPFTSPVRQCAEQTQDCKTVTTAGAHLPQRASFPRSEAIPTSPVPRPAFKKPRSQLKTRPRMKLHSISRQSLYRHVNDEDYDAEADFEGRAGSAMAMLLMAMKASDASAQAARLFRSVA